MQFAGFQVAQSVTKRIVMADYGDDDSQRRSGSGLTEKVKQTLGKVVEGVGAGGGLRSGERQAGGTDPTSGYGMGAGGGLGSQQQDPDDPGQATGAGTESYGMGMGSGTTPGSATMGYGGTGTGAGRGGAETDPYNTTGTRTGSGMGMGTDPYGAATDQPGMRQQQQGTGGYDDEGSLLERAKETLSSGTGGRRE